MEGPFFERLEELINPCTVSAVRQVAMTRQPLAIRGFSLRLRSGTRVRI